jgi:hypothetical protein
LVALVVILLVGSFTRYSATVWKSLPSMIESSALKAPTSARAQGQYAKLLFISGRTDDALAVIDRALENIPTDDPLPLTIKLYFLCATDRLESDEFDNLADRLSILPFDSRALKAYNTMAEVFVTGKCPNIELARLESTFMKMLDVPANGNPTSLRYSHVNWLIGYTRVHLMASKGFNHEALVLADTALSSLRVEFAENAKLAQKIRESDILAFIETVKTDLAAEQDADIPDPAE